MKLNQRVAARKRKERNQRIVWFAQDAIGVLALFTICSAPFYLF